MSFKEYVANVNEAQSQVQKVSGILGKPSSSTLKGNSEKATWKLKDGSTIEVDDAEARIYYMNKNGKDVIDAFTSVGQMKKALFQAGLLNESENLNEASPITIGEIPQKLMVAIDKVQKALGSDVKLIIDTDNMHEGIHGYIIGCEAKSFYPNAIRLEKSNLVAVSKVKELRWIEIEADYVTLAM